MENKAKTKSEALKFYAEQRAAMKAQMDETLMRAQYAKALFEIRDYTIKADKLLPEYDSILERETTRLNELREQAIKDSEEARAKAALNNAPSETAAGENGQVLKADEAKWVTTE